MIPAASLLFALAAGLLQASVGSAAGYPTEKNTQLVYQFPNETWVENIAVRSNNQLLVTLLTTPQLYSVDPAQPGAEPTLVYTFPNATSLFGIAETAPDVFAVLVSNFTAQGGAVPHTTSVWAVDFSTSEGTSGPTISKIAAVPQVIFGNGMCNLPQDPGVVLIGDIAAGQVYRFDTRTAAVDLVVPSSNSLVSSAPNPVFGTTGVDGLHVLRDELYVANAGRGTFGKIRINPNGTLAAGAEPQIIQRAPNSTYEDDFALDAQGNAYLVTGSGNTVIRVDPSGKQTLLAGNLNSTEIAEPTSAALSRGLSQPQLYVVTAGGIATPVNGDEIVGGQVLAIDL